jgi:hypothetical protein
MALALDEEAAFDPPVWGHSTIPGYLFDPPMPLQSHIKDMMQSIILGYEI